MALALISHREEQRLPHGQEGVASPARFRDEPGNRLARDEPGAGSPVEGTASFLWFSPRPAQLALQAARGEGEKN